MIEDIKLTGLSDEIINEMIETIGYDMVLNMACNYELVRRNITLLQSLGIKNIKNLLLNRENIFLKDTNYLIDKFSKVDIEELVSFINEDYSVIDKIIF